MCNRSVEEDHMTALEDGRRQGAEGKVAGEAFLGILGGMRTA